MGDRRAHASFEIEPIAVGTGGGLLTSVRARVEHRFAESSAPGGRVPSLVPRRVPTLRRWPVRATGHGPPCCGRDQLSGDLSGYSAPLQPRLCPYFQATHRVPQVLVRGELQAESGSPAGGPTNPPTTAERSQVPAGACDRWRAIRLDALSAGPVGPDGKAGRTRFLSP